MQILEDDRKFIPAQPCRGITFSNTRINTLSGLLEQAIAGLVAKTIIDFLEIIQVDKQQCRGGTYTLRVLYMFFQSIHKKVSIG